MFLLKEGKVQMVCNSEVTNMSKLHVLLTVLMNIFVESFLDTCLHLRSGLTLLGHSVYYACTATSRFLQTKIGLVERKSIAENVFFLHSLHLITYILEEKTGGKQTFYCLIVC